MSIEKDIKQKAFANPYQKLAVNLMFTNNWLMAEMHQLFKPHDLTEQQFTVLCVLKERYPIPVRVNCILENMRDEMSNVSRLVDKLCKKGLAVRCQAQSDKRAVDITITPEGVALTQVLQNQLQNWQAQALVLTDTEATQLQMLLNKIYPNPSEICK